MDLDGLLGAIEEWLKAKAEYDAAFVTYCFGHPMYDSTPDPRFANRRDNARKAVHEQLNAVIREAVQTELKAIRSE